MTDLLHDTREVRRDVAVSALTQGGAKALHLVLNVVSTLVIIRYLAPARYGSYVLVLTLSTLIGLVADFGLVKLATREVSRQPASEDEVIGTVLVVRLAMSVLCVGFLQLALFGLGVTAAVHLAGLLASLLYFGNALFVAAVCFYVRVKQQYEAAIRVGMEAVETACIVALVTVHAPMPALFVPPSASGLVGAVVAVVLARRRFMVRFGVALSRLPYLLKEALPLGPALLISVCYLKLDALMLVILRTPRDVGLYGSAYQPIEYAFLACGVVVNVVFPLASAAYAAGDHDRFALLYRRCAEVLFAALLVVPVTLSLVAVPLVARVYGPAYTAAARPLQILAVTLVLMALNGWQAFILLGGGHQGVTLAYNLGALAVAGVSCFVLVETDGMDGAALATLCTATFVLVCSSWAVRRYFDARLHMGTMARIAAAAALLWVVLWALQRAGAPWGALLPAAAAAYPLCLLALRVTSVSRLRSWSVPTVAGAGAVPTGA